MPKCEPQCTCNRHKAYYRGGSKKGRSFSDEARQNIAAGAQSRVRTDEDRQHLAEQMRANHADPEFEAKRIAALRVSGTGCVEGCTCGRHSTETRRKISEARSGVPLSEEHKRAIGEASRAMWDAKTPEEMEAIGRQRSDTATADWAERNKNKPGPMFGPPKPPPPPPEYDERWKKIAATRAAWSDEKRAEVSLKMSEAKKREWAEKGPDRNSVPGHLRSRVSNEELALIPYMEGLGFQHNSADEEGKCWIGRKVPDFVDFQGRRLFELFGVRHHYAREEQERIDYYASKGWSCEVLWEDQIFEWIPAHRHLCTEEQYETLRRAFLCRRTEEASRRVWAQQRAKKEASSLCSLTSWP